MSKYFITTLFRAVKSGSARDTLDGGNYRLVFENEHIFNDAFLTKLKKTYKKVEGVFYEANGNHLKPEFDALRKDLQEEKKGLNLKFFTLAGMGVSMSKLKFFEQHISEEIDLGDEKAMKNMIAMAILIPTFFPRVHASITVGGGRWVKYILHYNGFGIQTHAYAQCGESGKSIGAGSLWDDWKRDEYNDVVEDMKHPKNKYEYLGVAELRNFRKFTLPEGMGTYILPHFINEMRSTLVGLFGTEDFKKRDILPYSLTGPNNNILEFSNKITIDLEKLELGKEED